MADRDQTTITSSRLGCLVGRGRPPNGISSGVAYRLDDPAGEVGMEGFLLTDANGHTVHVPLSYRAQPLDGAEEHLLETTQHSVLGTRRVMTGAVIRSGRQRSLRRS